MAFHVFGARELGAVQQVLESGELCSINGTVGRQFEEAFAKLIGARRAVAVNSGMSALHCALYAAGAGAGDEVICDPMVQFGAMAVIYNNAAPIFADIRRGTHLIDPDSVRERITERTKAIVCTHLWGLPCDMDPLREIADEHGIAVIEDNAHGLLAEYHGRVTGTLGHMAEFSFQMSKHMGLGDAGITTVMDERFIDGVVDCSGINGLATFPKMMWNYRLNEVIAAIGLAQIQRVTAYVEMAIAHGEIYNEAVRDVEWLRAQHVPPGRKHAYHIWAGSFEGDKYGITREQFKRALAEAGVKMGVGYIERAAYLHDTFTVPLAYGRGCPMACPLQLTQVEYREGLCPVAEDLMPRILLTLTTTGSAESHRENAEKLRDVVRQFD